MEEKEIPYFIRMRGCINCSVSKEYKKRHGKEYGFDPEVMVKCLLIGCFNQGYDLTNPFTDVEEFMKFVNKNKENLTKENLENVRKYIIEIKQKFEKDYEKIGVSIEDLIKEI